MAFTFRLDTGSIDFIKELFGMEEIIIIDCVSPPVTTRTNAAFFAQKVKLSPSELEEFAPITIDF